jgi:tetratricopeptide (TPR) repeat protein
MIKKKSLLEDPIFQTLVAAISAAIARLTNLKTAGLYQEAHQEIDNRLEEIIGLKSDQLQHLGDAFIIDLLTVNEFLDVERLWYVAELIQAEGEIKITQGRLSEGQENQTRALGFFIEVAFAAGENLPQIHERIDSLFDRLHEKVPEEILFSLYDYYDQRGDYARALSALNQALVISRDNPDLVLEKKAYLQRLSQKTDEELERGDLTRGQIETP